MSGPKATPSPWITPGGGIGNLPSGSDETVILSPAVRHHYPLVARDAGLGAAIGLLMRTLPYALMRFAVMLAFTIATIIWLVIALGGAAWLGTHIAPAFGVVWVFVCLGGFGYLWWGVLRYALHLIACGHVAVLTELITKGAVGNGSESMFAYGRRIVTARIGQATVLLGLNMAVRGVLQAFHRTLDWISEMLPVPGLESLSNLLNVILRAATRYLDKVVFSYNLARGDQDPWRSSRDGIVYYCQNAKPILKTAVWVVVLERVLSFLLWVLLLAPAAAISVLLPESARAAGSIVTIVIAILLVGSLRSAFIKPLFLIMIMVRFHTVIENQAINPEWDARLSAVSSQFANLGPGLAARI